MDINEVANRAIAAYPQRGPAGRAQAQPAQPTIPGLPETARPRETAASSPGVQQAQPPTQAQSVPSDPAAREPADPEQLRSAVEKIQEFVSAAASDIQFSVDEDTGRTVVKVVDRQTQDIIRQIPSEEMLDLAQALDKLQGLLIKQKA